MSKWIVFGWYCPECELTFYVSRDKGEDLPVRCPYGDYSEVIKRGGRISIEGKEIYGAGRPPGSTKNREVTP